jgi:hypothetical protein
MKVERTPARGDFLQRASYIGALLAVLVTTAGRSAAGEEMATRVVTAGARYQAGGTHAFLLGDGYRDLWAAPIEVPVLDLDSFAGGLTVTAAGARLENPSLYFVDPTGRRYLFRSLDKDAGRALPPEWSGSGVASLAHDQTSAQLPAGVLIVDALLEAAGVRSMRSRLAVLGDSPRLGGWRAVFAGRLGTLEDVLDLSAPGHVPGFEDAAEAVASPQLFERRFASAARDGVDGSAYLRARLVDLLVGDWNRNPTNWRWVRRAAEAAWEPVSLGHDQAFSRYGGFVRAAVRQGSHLPLTSFDDDYGDLLRLVWEGLAMDRLFLAALDEAAWQRAVGELVPRLPDSVIDEAVGRLPAEYVHRRGAFLARALKARRDRLSKVAHDYYRLLAREAEIVGSEEAELAEVTRTADTLAVRVRAKPDGPVFFTRDFVPPTTKEVRLFLRGGDDEAVVRGEGPIKLRVIGGAGHDVLDDAGGHTRFYDALGGFTVHPGPGTQIHTRPYPEVASPSEESARDWADEWGVPVWLGISGDTGFFLGTGVSYERYGFRKEPYAVSHRIRAGYAFEPRKGRADYEGDFRRAASDTHFTVQAYASGIEVLRFYRFGNETESKAPDEFYKTDQAQYLLSPLWHWRLAKELELSVGPRLRYADTPPQNNRLIGLVRPYGVGHFGTIAAQADLQWDRRDSSVFPAHGTWVGGGGSATPALWSVDETYGEIHGFVGAAATVRVPFRSILLGRIGGTRVFGRYPFFDAAAVGGSFDDLTVRGLRGGRYTGDARAYGNAEIRVPLARIAVLAPADFGVVAFSDAGRVFYDGESSRRWHVGAGGGLWVAPITRTNVLMLTVAHCEDHTAVQVHLGFAF